MPLRVITVDFRNHKRNIRVHPEDGGVIDHDGARIPRYGTEFPGNLAAGTK
jgi:hypothetical protein